MMIETNIMSDDLLDYSGIITLNTDPVNHPGLIFYSLDDGKIKEEKIKETAMKVGAFALTTVLFFASQGAYNGQPILGPSIP